MTEPRAQGPLCEPQDALRNMIAQSRAFQEWITVCGGNPANVYDQIYIGAMEGTGVVRPCALIAPPENFSIASVSQSQLMANGELDIYFDSMLPPEYDGQFISEVKWFENYVGRVCQEIVEAGQEGGNLMIRRIRPGGAPEHSDAVDKQTYGGNRMYLRVIAEFGPEEGG